MQYQDVSEEHLQWLLDQIRTHKVALREYLDDAERMEKYPDCIICDRRRALDHYGLTTKMVALGYEALRWTIENKKDYFTAKQVFRGETEHISKLKLLGLVERSGSAPWWKMTERGRRFLCGLATLPANVWVRPGRKQQVIQDDLDVSVSDVLPDWKTTYFDWLNDYMVLTYQTMNRLDHQPQLL